MIKEPRWPEAILSTNDDNDEHVDGVRETTSLNCGHQRAYFSSPGDIWAIQIHGGMISTGKLLIHLRQLSYNPTSSHLIVNQKELGKKWYN
jgi:hypothetical protein